jgi:hypothetical protein
MCSIRKDEILKPKLQRSHVSEHHCTSIHCREVPTSTSLHQNYSSLQHKPPAGLADRKLCIAELCHRAKERQGDKLQNHQQYETSAASKRTSTIPDVATATEYPYSDSTKFLYLSIGTCSNAPAQINKQTHSNQLVCDHQSATVLYLSVYQKAWMGTTEHISRRNASSSACYSMVPRA